MARPKEVIKATYKAVVTAAGLYEAYQAGRRYAQPTVGGGVSGAVMNSLGRIGSTNDTHNAQQADHRNATHTAVMIERFRTQDDQRRWRSQGQ